MGHGYYDNCTVPIIENTARECELTDRLRQAIKDYPKSQAVLVRRHGVYVWGNTWIQAKTQAECYDYLFESAIKLRSLGVDASKPSVGAPAALTNGAASNGAPHNGHAHGAHSGGQAQPRLPTLSLPELSEMSRSCHGLKCHGIAIAPSARAVLTVP